MARNIYCLYLPFENHNHLTASESNFEIRTAQPANKDELSVLMIDSYKGTINSDGETLEDAINEIQNYLNGECGGRALINESYLAFARGQLVGACLVVEWQEKGQPLIAYIMTHPEAKKQGVGQKILSATLKSLSALHYSEVYAIITEGNTPSEKLFSRMGFQRKK